MAKYVVAGGHDVWVDDTEAGAAEVEGAASAMRRRLAALPTGSALRPFLATYLRTTLAVGDAVAEGRFEDPAWVGRWDAVFADLYLTALDAHLADDAARAVPRPWRLAFAVPPGRHPLQHVLVGVNAHVNFDLPQALLAVLSASELDDPGVMDRRRRDHERIDGVLAARVAAEDSELAASGPRSLLDRVLTPLNRLASRRFLREARVKVWHNTLELAAARAAGPGVLAERVGELEVLAAARVADLVRPGPVLLRLAVAGFGVVLPPPR